MKNIFWFIGLLVMGIGIAGPLGLVIGPMAFLIFFAIGKVLSS